MTETKRLYYEDVYKKEFTAKVLDCREAKKGFHIILDESAFYPEGGGQPSDAGYLNDVNIGFSVFVGKSEREPVVGTQRKNFSRYPI